MKTMKYWKLASLTATLWIAASSPANAALIDLNSLGLSVGSEVVTDQAGSTNLALSLGPAGFLFFETGSSTDPVFTINGIPDFGASDFEVTGALSGDSIAAASASNLIEILFDISGTNSALTDASLVLITISGAFGDSPFQSLVDQFGVASSVTVSSVLPSQVPTPASGLLLVIGLAGLMVRKRPIANRKNA